MDEELQEKEKPEAAAQALQAAVPAAPPQGKRKRTKGEIVFDIATYAGGAWVLNEIISAIVGRQIVGKEKLPKELVGKYEPRRAGDWNASFNKAVTALEKIPGTKRWMGRAAEIFILCTGGNLLVWPIKIAEDHKGKIVRWLDKKIEGPKGEANEALKAAHAEMDHAEKQSWGSILAARGVALVAAIVGDTLFAEENAYSTRLVSKLSSPESALNNWSSLQRIGVTITRGVVSFFSPTLRPKIEEARALSPHKILSTEGKVTELGVLLFFLTTLSGAVATVFYLSTRIFGKKVAKKEEGPLTISEKDVSLYGQETRSGEKVTQKSIPEKPSSKVGEITHVAAIAKAPQQTQVNSL